MSKFLVLFFSSALLAAPVAAASQGHVEGPPDQSGFGATTGSGNHVTGNGDDARHHDGYGAVGDSHDIHGVFDIEGALDGAGFSDIHQLTDGLYEATTPDGDTVHISVVGR